MAEEKKQEPEKPVKVKSESPIPMVGIIAFAIILIALLLNLWFLLGIKSQVSSVNEIIVASNPNIHGEKSGEKNPSAKSGESSKEDTSNKDTQYFETGRITTNPRASTSFVVINLGMIFKVKPSEEGDEKHSEGEKKDASAQPISPFGKRFDGMLRNSINSELGKLSVDEMQIPRDSLSSILKNKLVPLFLEEKSSLKDVVIVEFIIQQ
jgi:hypothetical protein